MTSYDTIILGSSPNALIAAAYLARGGQRVLVLEQAAQVGGAVSTAPFADGFNGDIGLVSGRIDPEIVRDLNLQDHGLDVIERTAVTSLLSNGRSFTLSSNRDQAVSEISKMSAHDAAKYKSFMQLVDLAIDFLRSTYTVTPYREHPPSQLDVQQLGALAEKLRGYGRREMTEVMRLLLMSVRDLLDEWFESTELKGLLASAGVRGLNQGPFAAATSFNLLHHLAIGDGYFRATARGGIGAISQSLSKAAQAFGAEVQTNVGPLQLLVTNETVNGVQAGGNTYTAASYVSDYDALYTFAHLVPPPELEPEFNRAVRHVHYNGSVARINLALSELPKFSGLTDEALRGTLTISPSIAYLERAFDSGKHGKLSEKSFVEMTIPSLSDPSLAPAGKHTMSIWIQYAPYRAKLTADTIYATALNAVSEFAPDLKSLIKHHQVTLPQDFETKFHLSEGQLYGGEMSLAQAFLLRPIPGFAQYHTPIANLYLCGAATHPGGGVHGLTGRNAARELGVRDLVPA
ncbi:MAG TPA: NAD(P)/FAD-dependent oxidoreductase [Trichormus sp.]|jgi:phytoene dehydrogenase-like protein